MMKKGKGFTLIELLAVIVILAIIALIATPIVLNIIKESKQSSNLQSAELYLGAVEYTVADAILNRGGLENGEYLITPEGDICKTELPCTTENTLKVEISGEKPINGFVKIQLGKIDDIELVYKDKIVTKNKEGRLGLVLYKIGQEVTFNPGDGDRKWNVIAEDGDTVTLMLTENLDGQVAWYSDKYNNAYGPQSALDYLNNITTGWTNVEQIENYSYVNNLNGSEKPYGYQKIEINNGITIITHKDDKTTTLDVITRSRLLSLEEVLEIASKINEDLTLENLKGYVTRNLDAINRVLGISAKTIDEVVTAFIAQDDNKWLENEIEQVKLYILVQSMKLVNLIDTKYNVYLPDFLHQNLNKQVRPFGYWTLSSNLSYSGGAWCVGGYANVNDYTVDAGTSLGVRPVITISKAKLK